jgi:hypothetical protein
LSLLCQIHSSEYKFKISFSTKFYLLLIIKRSWLGLLQSFILRISQPMNCQNFHINSICTFLMCVEMKGLKI